MNKLGKFERKLVEKFEKHDVEKDYDRLWNQLEPKLPKKRRRYFFIWIFGLALLLMALVGLLELQEQSITEMDSSSTISNAIVEEEIFIKNSKTPVESKSEPLIDEGNSNQKLIDTEAQFLSNKSPVKSIKSMNGEITSGLNSSFVEAKISNVKTRQPFLSNDLKVNKYSTEKENQNDKFESILIESNELSITKNQTNNHKGITLLSVISSLNLGLVYKSDLYEIKNPDTTYYMKQVAHDESKFAYGLQLLMGSHIAKGMLSNDLIHLQDNLKPLLTYTGGLKFSYRLNPKIGLGLSTEYFNITEKLAYKNEIKTSGFAINNKAFKVNDVYLPASQEREINTTYDILKYNNLSGWTITPRLSLFPFNQRKLDVSLFCSMIFAQSYSGALLDQDLNLVNVGSLIDNRRMSKLNPGFSLGYPIKDFGRNSLNVLLRYQYSQVGSDEKWHRYMMGITIGL